MPTFSLATLRQMALDRVDNNTQFYTYALGANAYFDIDAVINEAIRIANLFTGFIQASVNLPGFTQATTLIYSTPAPIIIPVRVSYNGVFLDRTPVARLAQYNPAWATETTASYGPVQEWVPLGITLFALHPIDSVGGANLNVIGVQEPTPLVNANDVINLPDEFVPLITEYCAHRLPLKEGGSIFAQGAQAFRSWSRKMKTLSRWEGVKMPLLETKIRQIVKVA